MTRSSRQPAPATDRAGALLPMILVFVSAVMWGTYGSFVTAITGLGMSRSALVLVRAGITVIVLFAVCLVKDRALLRVRVRDLWLFLANGLVSVVFFVWCYTAAIAETKIATAAALLYTAPAIVLVISAIVFHERLTVRKVVCIGLAVVGCALVSGIGPGGAAGAGLTVRGLLLGLGAGLGYALYSIFSTVVLRRGYSPYTNVLYTFAVATAGFAVLAAMDGTVGEIAALPQATGLAVVCGFVTCAIPYVLYTNGLAGMSAPRAAQIACIEPVTAAVLGVALFGQALGATELAGIALVVGSVVAMNAGGAESE